MVSKIIEILWSGARTDSKGRNYISTYALLDDGTEAKGWGEFRVGDPVRTFYDPKYDTVKMKLYLTRDTRHARMEEQTKGDHNAPDEG